MLTDVSASSYSNDSGKFHGEYRLHKIDSVYIPMILLTLILFFFFFNTLSTHDRNNSEQVYLILQKKTSEIECKEYLRNFCSNSKNFFSMELYTILYITFFLMESLMILVYDLRPYWDW